MTSGPEKRILLLGNDPGDQQWSILEYEKQLQNALRKVCPPEWKISVCAPNTLSRNAFFRKGRVGKAAGMYWSRYVRYPQLLKAFHADLYHVLDHGNGWLIHLLPASRTVITCHDLIPLLFQKQQGSLIPWFSRRAFRHAISGLPHAAAVLANSPQTQRDLLTHLKLDPRRIHVTPLGIDPELRPPASAEQAHQVRKKLNLPTGTLLLHVGKPTFYKNLEGLFQCLKLLLEKAEPVWLVRVGENLSFSQRQQVQQLGVSKRMIELGPLPREQIRQLYQAVDLLLFPSWYEGQGLPPLEAMASGLPVIASNRGALSETVAEAGLLVEPDSPAQMAQAVQRLIYDSSLRDQLRVAGIQRAALFRWETNAAKTSHVYHSILSQERSDDQ